MSGLSDVEFVLYKGYDVTGMVRGLTDEIVNNIEDRQVAGNDILTHAFVGATEATVDLTGFYDADLSAVLDDKSTGAVLMYVLEGNAAGDPCECSSDARPANYKRAVEKQAFHKAELKWQAQGDSDLIDHAVLIAPLAARTAADDTTASYVDMDEATTSGGRWWVTVTALDLDDYTAVVVKLLDSADHISFGDVTDAEATFTDVGGQMIAFTGNLKQYTACDWSYTGAGTSPSVTFAAALTKIPD